MEFNEVLSLVLKYCPFLSANKYDGLIIKKLAPTNTISDTGASHQSHMAFTGKQKDIFPYLCADEYFDVAYENKDDDLKKFYTLRIPLIIYADNVSYLEREGKSDIVFSKPYKTVNASVIRSRRNNAEDQIELSIKSLDDSDFIAFRKLFKVDDFFVLLKRQKELKYDLVGIKSDNEDSARLAKCTDFYKSSGSQTPVDLSSFTETESNNKIPFPFNRILFGAPGTGKSHKLKNDSSSFINQEKIKIEELIQNEINEASTSKDKSCRYIAIGFNYSESLKNLTPSEIQSRFGISDSNNNIYIGVRSKQFFNKIKEESETDISSEIKKAQDIKGDGMYPYLAAIGFKFSDKVCLEKEELKSKYNLESNPQSGWLYLGAKSAKYITQKHDSEIKYMERVTFHPNYSYAQFVGSYKPVTNDDGEISYEYIPGPFMRVYVNAIKNSGKNFLLLIEEINRANVAAVFGDVFQLLDRYGESGDENGNYALCSEYPVNVSEDIRKFFASKGINDTEMRIPSNMYIWATMNSADQGVMPMDAAFKRRWDFEYIGIDDGEDAVAGYKIPLTKDGSVTVSWNAFRKALNDKLSDIGINEDKLLGPFFLSKSCLENAINDTENFVSLFKSKIIMYLFEDVVKMQPAKLFNVQKMRYSEICKEFDQKGLEVFGLTDDNLNKADISKE